MQAARILFLAPAQTVTRIFPQLRDAGYDIGIADSLKGASAFIRKGLPDLVLSRPFLPGYRIDDLMAVADDDPNFPDIIVFSERISPEEATKMLELGARDYWAEPLTFEKIEAALPALKNAVEPVPSSTLGERNPLESKGHVPSIVGNHASMKRVLALAKQVATSKATVLISGESGTGKEMFSRFLHAQSDRKDKPFIAVNCAALPEHLLESELFGHEKGAFTGAIARKLGKFELASSGTLLLDEISEMELGLQAKLLRVIQEGELDRVGGVETVKVDVRILATTNRNLEDWVKDGKFRQDLYFRLNVIPLRLPSLKEREDDIMTLANFFLNLYSREYSLPKVEISAEAQEWLKNYDWPGNVRELQNLMERASLLCAGQNIAPKHFLLGNDEWPLFEENEEREFAPSSTGNENITDFFSENTPEKLENQGHSGVIPLHEMERLMIQKGLLKTGGNRTQAAELLGISVRTLRNKLNEYRSAGISIE